MSDISIDRLGIIKHISHEHILSAIHLAKLAHKVEADFELNKKIEDVPYFSHKAYVTGSIMLCVAFLEARVNEIIIGATINVNPWNEGMIDKKLYESLQEMGKIDGIKYLRTLEKYQLLLSFLGVQPFETGTIPYQDADLLIALRNRLIHFEPEVQWIDNEHRLVRKFKGKKLTNPIAQYIKHSVFPDILLGYECAKWAIISSISFVSEFDSKLKLTILSKGLEKELP